MLLSILKNISLSRYTTFKIGGQAKFFVAARSVEEIQQAVQWAKKNKEEYFILGGGSNILIVDEGFNGLVIKIQNTKYGIVGTCLVIGAGMPLAQLVAISIKNNLIGLEWAAGIPGTVGGAVRGNAGAFGGEMAQVVKDVKVLANNKIKKINLKDLKFGYRDSVFKSPANQAIILEIKIKLKKGTKQESLELVKRYSQFKKQTQALEYPSAGCVFKNYQFKKKDKKLLRECPELRNIMKNNIISTGWLIEQCGLKGKKIGGAAVSEKHANFIVNINQASANDVLELVKIIKNKVKEKFDIDLEEEIKIFSVD